MHIIRLRGPWEQEPIPDGRVCWTRRFHRPTGLDANSRVWLVIEELTAQAELALNGQQVTVAEHAAAIARLDITPLLQPNNRLTVTVPSPRPLGAVRLEIEDVVTTSTPSSCAAG